jgi:protein-disulfide isomerase
MSKRKKDSTKKGPAKGNRARTVDRRQKRQKQKRQQQRTFALIATVAAVVIAGFLFIIVNQPADAPIPEGTIERYQGIPQSLTEDGFPILGNPNAPVQVVEYSNFSCPSCARFHDSIMDDLVEMVRDGKISLVFSPIASTAGSNAKGAAQAALCVAEQGMFFEYHDALFSWHLAYGNKAFSQNRLKSGLDSFGLSHSLYGECDGSYIDDVIDLSEKLFIDGAATLDANVSYGTPAVFVDGFYVRTTDLLVTIETRLATAAENGIMAVPLDAEEEAVDDSEDTETDAVDDVEATDEAMDTDTDAADDEAEATDEAMDTDADADEDDTEATPEATAETANDG